MRDVYHRYRFDIIFLTIVIWAVTLFCGTSIAYAQNSNESQNGDGFWDLGENDDTVNDAPAASEVSTDDSTTNVDSDDDNTDAESDDAVDDEALAEEDTDVDMVAERATLSPWHSLALTPEGAVGFQRIASAKPGKIKTAKVGFMGEYSSGTDVIRFNDQNDAVVGNLQINAIFNDYFSANLAVRAKNNVNTFGRSQAMLSQGDTVMAVRTHLEVVDGLTLGGDLSAYLPTGFGTAGFQTEGMSWRPRFLMTFDWAELADAQRYWDTHINLGFKSDNSYLLVPEGRRLSRVESFAYDISAYDMFEIGIGLQLRLPYVSPFMAWNLGIPTGESPDLCDETSPLACVSTIGFASYPHTVSVGVVGNIADRLGVHAGVDIGLTREHAYGLPATLPYNVLVGLNWAIDFVPQVVVEEVETVVETEKIVEVEKMPPLGFIRGTVADRVTKEPVGNALIQYVDRDESMQATSEESGAFRSYGFKPGEEIVLRIVHPHYRPTRVRHIFEEGEQVLAIEIAPMPRQARVQGLIKDDSGTPIEGALVRISGQRRYEITTDANGSFDQELPAGRYTIAANSEGYQTAGRDVQLEADSVFGLDIVLRISEQESLAELVQEEIRIYERIFFETGNAVLLPRSYNVLNDVATVLLENPQIKRLRIEGHTDDVGDAAMNMQLSRDRAQSVREYLMEQGGIGAERLVSEGFGADKPLVPNTSDRNRSVNRRVEFRVMDQGTD